MTNANYPHIAFIGGGNMARSIIGGLLAAQWPAANIHVSDPMAVIRQGLEADFAINCYADNHPAAAASSVWVLAVKPQKMAEALNEMASIDTNDTLIISIAAGITMATIGNAFKIAPACIRVMPNTPALVGLGVSGLVANERCNDTQKQLAEQIMGAVGIVEWFSEEGQIDVVTGVSGSGPAYFFRLIEALEKAAIEAGLTTEQARKMSLATAQGACQLASASDTPIATLRENVTSPGGTTAAALTVMNEADIDGIMASAVNAAIHRAGELANS